MESEGTSAAARAWSDLEIARDEARLQLHLLSRDARDAWDRIERGLEELEKRVASRGERVADNALSHVHEARERIHTFLEDHARVPDALATNLGDIMTETVHTCRPNDPLSRAAALMWEHDCGIVPVTDEEGHLVGVLTDRDVCMAVQTQGVRPTDSTVATAMARDLTTCGPEHSLADALDAMEERQVRRIPITSVADDSLLGIVSFGDVVRHVHALPASSDHIAACARLVRTLSRISEPRKPTSG